MVKTWRFALDYTAVDKIVRSSALMFHWLATLKLLCNGGLRKMSNVQILLTGNWPQSENFKKYNRMNETRPWTFSMLQPAHWALLTHMRLMHCHMAVSIVMRAVDNACHQYIDLARSCVINDRRVPRSSQPVNRQRRPDHWLTTDQCPLCHGQPSREDKFTNRGNCRTAERERCTRASWTFWYHNSIINCTSLLIFATTPLTIGQWTLARIIRSFKA